MTLEEFQHINKHKHKLIFIFDGDKAASMIMDGQSDKLKIAIGQMFEQKPELMEWFAEIINSTHKGKIILLG